jgi:hypothetical protein
MERQFTVVLTYQTCGDNARDALKTMLSAIKSETGFYVEVHEDGKSGTVLEGDITETRD